MNIIAVNKILQIFIVQLILQVGGLKSSRACPDEGRAHHGEWRIKDDDSDNITCELYCHHGYNIRGCDVITKDAKGHWSHDIPTCEEVSRFSVTQTVCKLAKFAPGFALDLIGFSKVGIVKNSLAAKLMSWLGNVKKGSLFAELQRYGMKGVYPIEKIDEICEALADYLFSKKNCTPKTEL